MSVEDSIVINVEPNAAYAQIADPSQMGRWSPENKGAMVPSPGQPATVGTEFVGSNARGRGTWVTRCTVTAADPGRRFAFRVGAIGWKTPRTRAHIATWEYDFEPVDGGTRVTERWTDERTSSDRFVAIFDRLVAGKPFADFQRQNIARTLANLKTELERS